MFFGHKLFIVIVFSGLFLLYTGCAKSTQPDDFDANDGNAGFMASEVNDMDIAILDSMGSGSLAKAVSVSSDTIRIERIISRWHLSADSTRWVRRAEVDYPSGTRVRTDTAIFFDINGMPIAHPGQHQVDSIYHCRTVTRTSNGNTVESDLKMGLKIHRETADTFAVKNGTIVGSYNGFAFRTTTVTNVTRHRENGQWNRFPTSGEIDIDREALIAKRARTIRITFSGGNTATAVVTRKSDGKQVTVIITLTTGTES